MKTTSDYRNQTSRSGSLPEEYREVQFWMITEKPRRIIVLQILSLLLFIVFGLIFFSLAVSLGNLPAQFSFGIKEIGMITVSILLTLVLHELTHGVVMQMFGARPQYGVIWKKFIFYATSPGHAFRRNHYVGVALAPLFLLSVVCVLGMWLLRGTSWVAVLALCASINVSGSIGDMWLTSVVLRYDAAAYVMDEKDGMRVFLPKS